MTCYSVRAYLSAQRKITHKLRAFQMGEFLKDVFCFSDRLVDLLLNPVVVFPPLSLSTPTLSPSSFAYPHYHLPPIYLYGQQDYKSPCSGAPELLIPHSASAETEQL